MATMFSTGTPHWTAWTGAMTKPPPGVNLNGIAPGYIATDNTQALRDDPVRSEAILERIPRGRWGTPEDFAGLCVLLASDADSYLNGGIVTVDGGWMDR